MAQIIKTYRQSVPAMRFIGKKYEDGDRVNGGFGKQWGDGFPMDGLKSWIRPVIQNQPMRMVMHSLGSCAGKRESLLNIG